MAFNYSKLLGKIKEKGLTHKEFASMIGTNPTTLSLKLSNHAKFKQVEIEKACSVLGIDAADIGAYFFAREVQKN